MIRNKIKETKRKKILEGKKSYVNIQAALDGKPMRLEKGSSRRRKRKGEGSDDLEKKRRSKAQMVVMKYVCGWSGK